MKWPGFARGERSAATSGELAWTRARVAAARWGLAGAALGVLAGLVAFAPAAWLARGVAAATQQRVLLTEARGTLWSGSAVAVLGGGPDSRDAAVLPGRLRWLTAWRGSAFELRLSDDCCIDGSVALRVQPGFSRLRVMLLPGGPSIGHWPAAWLSGLGTPWNTLQLGGMLRLASPGLVLESVAGRWRLDGRAEVELLNVSSRLSTLDALGSYRITLTGDAAAGAPPRIDVSTLGGALQFSGSGSLNPNGVRFRGEARASPGDEAALSNLLNIMGRREGARTIISIG